MARKLKTYQTSLGFFEQAIAAPSMKAALEAWGADSNLFHQGAAKESHDPDVIAATMAKPGVVLKRPVGSDGPLANTPNCRRTSTRMDGRAQPASRQSRRRSLPPSWIRRRTERRLKRTNGSASVASARKPGRRRPGRRNTHVGEKPSTRRKRRWTTRRRSTRNAWPRCVPKLRPSRKRYRPRRRIGTRKRSG
jgi:colicin import membrane protein